MVTKTRWSTILQNSKKLIPGKSSVATLILMLATYGIFEAYQTGYSRALNEHLSKKVKLEQEIDTFLQHLTKDYNDQFKNLTNHNSKLETNYIVFIESLEKSEVEIDKLKSQLRTLKQTRELEYNSRTIELKSADVYNYTIQLIRFYESQIKQLSRELIEVKDIDTDNINSIDIKPVNLNHTNLKPVEESNRSKKNDRNKENEGNGENS